MMAEQLKSLLIKAMFYNGLAMKRSRIVSSKLTKQIQMITKNATLKKDRNSAMFYSFCYVAFILWNTKW